MAMHTQTFGRFLCLLLYWTEQRMAEVALACGSIMGLDVVPEVVVGQFEYSREESQKTTINGFGEVVAECFNLIHERVQAFGCTAHVLPVGFVPVELLDAIGGSTVTLALLLVFQHWLIEDMMLTLNPYGCL
jgi:hypothetical protein